MYHLYNSNNNPTPRSDLQYLNSAIRLTITQLQIQISPPKHCGYTPKQNGHENKKKQTEIIKEYQN